MAILKEIPDLDIEKLKVDMNNPKLMKLLLKIELMQQL